MTLHVCMHDEYILPEAAGKICGAKSLGQIFRIARGACRKSSRGIFLQSLHRNIKGMKMAATATLSSKFQISIPKAVREQQQWQAGQEFVFIPKGAGVLVMPVPARNTLQGIARGANPDNYRDRQDRY